MKHLNIGKCFFVGIISFIAMLSALINVPALAEVETCVRAALVITGAYAWFAGVLWANLILPLTHREK